MLDFANVLDRRTFETQGAEGPRGIFILSPGSRALPFVVFRRWSMNGMVAEGFRIKDRTGLTIYEHGPEARDLRGGSAEPVVDVIDDARFPDGGSFAIEFLVQGRKAGEVEIPVMIEEPTLPKEFEEGLKKPDAIWVGTEDRTAPCWFAYKNGKIYLLSQTRVGPEEQTVPGLTPQTNELCVVTRRKGRETSLDRFHASVRVLQPGPEWDQVAAMLVDRRRSRLGPPKESIDRWRDGCLIAELTPIVSG